MTTEISGSQASIQLAQAANKKTVVDARSAVENTDPSELKAPANNTQDPLKSQQPEPSSPDTQEQIESMVASLNQVVQNQRRNLQFNIDKDSGQTVIKVFDSETEKLIRQIPTAEAMEISRFLEELQSTDDTLSNFLIRDLRA